MNSHLLLLTLLTLTLTLLTFLPSTSSHKATWPVLDDLGKPIQAEIYPIGGDIHNIISTYVPARDVDRDTQYLKKYKTSHEKRRRLRAARKALGREESALNTEMVRQKTEEQLSGEQIANNAQFLEQTSEQAPLPTRTLPRPPIMATWLSSLNADEVSDYDVDEHIRQLAEAGINRIYLSKR